MTYDEHLLIAAGRDLVHEGETRIEHLKRMDRYKAYAVGAGVLLVTVLAVGLAVWR